MKDFHVVLADRAGVGKVHLCDCQAVHLSVGPVTINMVPEMFAQMVHLVREAMDSLSMIAAATQLESDSTATTAPCSGTLPN